MVKTRQSLAVKYRPKALDQVIGQDEIVNLLKGQFKSKGGLNRAFLLKGPSGTGKTTCARIIAHAVNCQNFNRETFEPCWECEYCKQVKIGNYPDVEEINFSESRGIDTVRGIIDSMVYEPQYNTKVYILDEMQCITTVGQNALLKPIEEPPEGVMFLLLTTDPQKLLFQITTRCTTLELKKVSDSKIIGFLKLIAKQEKKTFLKDGVFKRIAMHAKGHVRQALSSMEAIIYAIEGDEKFNQSSEEELDRIIGQYVDTSQETNLFQYLIGGVYQAKYASAIWAIHQIVKDPKASNHVYIANKLNDYHLQSLYMLIDPKKTTTLLDPGYSSWHKTLVNATKDGGMLLTHQAAAEIAEVLLDLQYKLQSYQFDVLTLFTVTTVKLISIVKAYEKAAYTKESPFHMENMD